MNKFRGDFKGGTAYHKANELLNILEEIREHLHNNLLSLDEDTLDTLLEVESEIKTLRKDY